MEIFEKNKRKYAVGTRTFKHMASFSCSISKILNRDVAILLDGDSDEYVILTRDKLERYYDNLQKIDPKEIDEAFYLAEKTKLNETSDEKLGFFEGISRAFKEAKLNIISLISDELYSSLEKNCFEHVRELEILNKGLHEKILKYIVILL